MIKNSFLFLKIKEKYQLILLYFLKLIFKIYFLFFNLKIIFKNKSLFSVFYNSNFTYWRETEKASQPIVIIKSTLTFIPPPVPALPVMVCRNPPPPKPSPPINPHHGRCSSLQNVIPLSRLIRGGLGCHQRYCGSDQMLWLLSTGVRERKSYHGRRLYCSFAPTCGCLFLGRSGN